MKAVQAYFNEIYEAIFSQLEEPAQAIAHYLFGIANEQYGFDQGQAKDIDEWLNKNHPEHKIALSQKSRDIFNSLFKLYQANTHLMLLYKLIDLAHDIGNNFQIIKVSEMPEILDIRKLRPDEPRERIDQQMLIDTCYRNNQKALGMIINLGIKISIVLPWGSTWQAAFNVDKSKLSDSDLLQANITLNKVAKENLKYYEEDEKHSLARKNLISICKNLLAFEILKDENQNPYFNYTFKPETSTNIDAWLSTHSPYKDDVKQTILEPQTKEILNNLFKLYRANEKLTFLQDLLTKDPNFCKQFKIIQLYDNPIIFDISKKSQSEIYKSELIKTEEIAKCIQKNIASGMRLMKDTNIYLPVNSQLDYLFPLTTPKVLNFKYNELSEEKAKLKITSAVKEDNVIHKSIMPKNHPERSHTPSPPRSE